jgi:hypothetical protein
LRALFPSGHETIGSGVYNQVGRSTVFLCQRFFKQPIDELPPIYGRREWLKGFFFQIAWHDVYNLLEFIANNQQAVEPGVRRDTLIESLNSVLSAEMSGYRFVNDCLAPITNQHEIASIEATRRTGQSRELLGVQTHIETAVALLSKKPEPDFRNSIKESISAVESIAKAITGEESGGLERPLAILDKKVGFHGGFKAGLLAMYGYASDEDGVRHAMLEEPNVGFDEAKFMLVACSAFVNFIIAKADQCGLLEKGN